MKCQLNFPFFKGGCAESWHHEPPFPCDWGEIIIIILIIGEIIIVILISGEIIIIILIIGEIIIIILIVGEIVITILMVKTFIIMSIVIYLGLEDGVYKCKKFNRSNGEKCPRFKQKTWVGYFCQSG